MNLTQLKKELVNDEGLKPNCYQDSVGLWTIGVGHLLGSERRMISLTQDEIDALLEKDIQNAIKIVWKYVPESLYWDGDSGGPGSFGPSNQSRYRALVNMAFNLGDRLGGFVKFLAAVNKHDWQTAATEMMNSKWATQVGDRATRLRDMILTDD